MRSKSKISGGGSELAEGVEGLNPGKPGPAKAGVHRLRKKSNFGVFCCCRLWQGLKPSADLIGFIGPRPRGSPKPCPCYKALRVLSRVGFSAACSGAGLLNRPCCYHALVRQRRRTTTVHPAEPLVFSDITPEQYARLTQKATAAGISMSGDSGTASSFGVGSHGITPPQRGNSPSRS